MFIKKNGEVAVLERDLNEHSREESKGHCEVSVEEESDLEETWMSNQLEFGSIRLEIKKYMTKQFFFTKVYPNKKNLQCTTFDKKLCKSDQSKLLFTI